MFYIIGIFITFFLALLLATKHGRNLADSILSIWMLIIGGHLFSYYSFVSGLLYEYPILMNFNLPYAFLHGPLLLLYTCALTNPERFSTKKWMYNFVLPLVILCLDIPYLFYSLEEKIAIYKGNGESIKIQTYFYRLALILSGIFYVYSTNRLLQGHKKRILNQFTNQEKINLNWLRILFYSMAFTWVLIIFVDNDVWIFSTSTIFVVFIGYFGIKQVGIFTNKNLELPEIVPPDILLNETGAVEADSSKRKYAKSGLNDQSSKDLHQHLQDLMQSNKVFTEPELTLTELAERLDTNPNYLTRIGILPAVRDSYFPVSPV